MPPARSAKSTPRPRRPTSAASTRRTRSSSGECSAARVADLPLALWPCAQRTSQWQRHGRFLPESNRHPAKMLPEIARRVIAAYSDPGDLVLDPMCGIATTLIEAIHLERRDGVELEGRWASLAAKNIAHARGQGARGQALVLQDDARYLGRGVLDDLAGQVPLILTSPPYGNATLGDPRGGREWPAHAVRRTPDDRSRPCSRGQGTELVPLRRQHRKRRAASLRHDRRSTHRLPSRGELPRGDGRDLHGLRKDAQPRRIPRARHEEPPRGRGAAKHRREHHHSLQQIGLVFQQHIVALLAALRDGELLPRPSYFQLNTSVKPAHEGSAPISSVTRTSSCSNADPQKGVIHATLTRKPRLQVKQADCFTALPRLDADSVDAIVTDRPTASASTAWRGTGPPASTHPRVLGSAAADRARTRTRHSRSSRASGASPACTASSPAGTSRHSPPREPRTASRAASKKPATNSATSSCGSKARATPRPCPSGRAGHRPEAGVGANHPRPQAARRDPRSQPQEAQHRRDEHRRHQDRARGAGLPQRRTRARPADHRE